MTLKHPYISSFIFAAISGIVNIYGIRHFGLVVTNITGHFSEMVQVSGEKIYPILGFIICYLLGAFGTFSCFLIAEKYQQNKWKVLPLFINLLIFLWFVILQNSPIYLLFFAMSSQNALGINLSNGSVRPSQITGVVISLGDDLARYFFKIQENKPLIVKSFIIKVFNMLGFIAGGFIVLLYDSYQILYLPIIFYIVLIIKQLINKLI